MNKIVLIDEKLCIGCGVCVAMCPRGILQLDENTSKCKVTDESSCDRRRGCVHACPVNAIQIR